MAINLRKTKLYQEIKYFEKTSRDWLFYHLDCGYPTYYSILSVDKAVDLTRLNENYLFKQQNSYFPLDIIDDAYKTIKKIELRNKYNRFLKMFHNYYQLLDDEERSELEKKHSELQFHERAKILLSLVLENHKNWEILYLIGINLYFIAKIKPENNYSDIIALNNKYCKSRAKYAKIQVLISKLFLNFFVFKQYKVFLSLYPSIVLNDKKEKSIKKLQKYWYKFNFTFTDFNEIFLSNEPLWKMLDKYQSIISKNNDWLEYLPPHKKTFYEVLNIEGTNLNSSDSLDSTSSQSQFKDLLFRKYKIAQKTSETNLAYMLLKNPQERADYDWMLKYNLIFMKIHFLLNIDYLDSIYLNNIIKSEQSIEDVLIQYKHLRYLNYKF